MPLSDVTVTIDIQKPTRLIGLGKPLILAKKTGTSTYKSYSDLTAVKADYAESTNAYKKAAAIFAQDHAPAEIAIASYDTAASAGDPKTPVEAVTKYFENDWYFLLTTDATNVEQTAVADYVESQKYKIYVTKATAAADRTAFKTKAYDRTVVFYHTIVAEEPDAALVGELGSQTVGSITWKFKTLKGITPLDLTKTELNAIHTDKAIAYVTKAGIRQTSEGTVASGEYIDVIHGKDWVKTDMENNIQTAFANNPKLSFDARGISVLNGQATTTLLRGVTNGIIAVDDDENPLFTVKTKSRLETPVAERAARVYKGLSFSFQLAGAIHTAEISGEILK
ncbi:DUF3383 family protein [Peribacillus asahii]|uniref:DUF3383 family protein n=1 Tax=Peribacillus asahii TaxID=228899 RepID=A0A398BAK5_9BACI|nr:DUF3383 family protein [Peribacillus asahii]RID87055.1 DUF3383 family protein [Peribacillus asahii]